MRAATSKPAWYAKRGLPCPGEVIAHRIEMLRRKQLRPQTREDMLAMRQQFIDTLTEMRAEGAIEEEEMPALIEEINAMPMPRKQEMAMTKRRGKRPVPLRKEYPDHGTE